MPNRLQLGTMFLIIRCTFDYCITYYPSKITKSHRKGNAPYYILLFVDYYVELQKLLSYNLPPKDSAWCLDSYARLVALTATYIRFMIMNLILVGIWLFTKHFWMKNRQFFITLVTKTPILVWILYSYSWCWQVTNCWLIRVRGLTIK